MVFATKGPARLFGGPGVRVLDGGPPKLE